MLIQERIIDYQENEQDIMHWVTLKGEYRYQIIMDVMEKANIPLKWKEITNCIKYDKRLVINLFKYIVFLEEYIKSMLYKYTSFSSDKILWFEFGKAINEFNKLKNIQVFDNMNVDLLKNSLNAIVCFRNSVVHNKILIGQSFDGKPLKEMIDIYLLVLPQNYRAGFKKDIDGCDLNLDVANLFGMS